MLAHLLWITLAAADAPVPLVRPPDDVVESAPTAASSLRVGAAFSVGSPTGLALTPFVRPLTWLQLEGQLGYDGAAPGLGAGFTLGAFELAVTPTLSAGVGHFFRGDMSGTIGKVTGVDLSRFTSARELDFDHLELQAGLMVGGERMRLFARAGASYVRATLHDFQSALQATTGDPTLTASDPTLTAWIPSAQLGLQVSF